MLFVGQDTGKSERKSSEPVGLSPEENQGGNREKDTGGTYAGPAGNSPGLRAEQRADRTA